MADKTDETHSLLREEMELMKEKQEVDMIEKMAQNTGGGDIESGGSPISLGEAKIGVTICACCAGTCICFCALFACMKACTMLCAGMFSCFSAPVNAVSSCTGLGGQGGGLLGMAMKPLGWATSGVSSIVKGIGSIF